MARIRPRPAGTGSLGVATHGDATGREQVEAALRASEERFRLATEALAGFLYDWDPESAQVEWFGGLEQIAGFRLDEVVPSLDWWWGRVHPDDQGPARRAVGDALEGGAAAYSQVYRIMHREGHYVDVADRGRIVRNRSGQAVRVLGGVSDISERKRLEREREALLESERQARAAAEAAIHARDDVLGVVSHELGNSLSAIALCTTALLQSEETSLESIRTILAAIKHSAEATGRLIRDLSDVASIEAGHLVCEPYDEAPDLILQQVAEMFAAAASDHGVLLETQSTPALPAVHADAERVVQGLANLVTNSLKFTEPGGRIILRAQTSPGGVRFAVEDTGIGIAAEDLPHVFDRYWQKHRARGNRGTGLGLAIVRGIVDAHGGQLRVESTPGKGSQFSFTIPVAGA